MFESLRKRSAIAALKNLQRTQKRTRKTWSLETARSIAVLFDATDEKSRKDTLEWAKELEKGKKEIRLLGFFDTKKPPVITPGFDFFFTKETKWNHAPSSAKASAFVQHKTDILIVVNPNQRLQLEWVALQHQAAMKIGTFTDHPHDFDLQIETPADKGVPFFAQQLKHYLEKIK